MTNCLVIDIDGTLSDPAHRLHFIRNSPKDYDSFHRECINDSPQDDIIFLVNLLVTAKLEQKDFALFICSGRPETIRKETEDWLEQYVPRLLDSAEALLMRKENDFRPDPIIKMEMKQAIEGQGYEIRAVLDDRQRVVDAWRANGITCLQVAAWQEEPIQMNPGTLRLMVGPSGAGKSLLATRLFPAETIISSDSLRKQITGDFRDMSKDSIMWPALHKIVQARIQAGADTVVDATNLKNSNRKALLDLQYQHGKIEYHVINRSVQLKKMTGGWRNAVSVKGKPIIEYHEDVFQSNLKDILAGDNDERVTVHDHRFAKNNGELTEL